MAQSKRDREHPSPGMGRGVRKGVRRGRRAEACVGQMIARGCRSGSKLGVGERKPWTSGTEESRKGVLYTGNFRVLGTWIEGPASVTDHTLKKQGSVETRSGKH